MKKWLAALLIAILALAPAALAEKQVKGKWGQKTVFSMTYDEKRFEVDTKSLVGENTATTRYQFSLYDDSCFVTCFIDYYDWMTGFSSYLASEAEMKLYIEDTLAAYKDVETRVVEVYPVTVTRGSKTATLPFLILRLADDEGVFYQAEVVSHGYCISFNCGTEDGADGEEALLGTIKALLDTFEPISE